MSADIDICFVGCGAIAEAHAKRLKGRARLWFASRNRASAESLNAAVGGAGVFAGPDEAMASAVDAVAITSPPEAHAEQVIAGLAAGKAVFVEKPLCVDREEVEAIRTAANGRMLMVGENYCYKPSLSLIRGWIDAGEIGTVRSASVRKCSMQASEGWKLAHGALFEGGVHFVALLSGLFGDVTAVRSASFPGARPERHARVTLEYGEVTADLEYAWDTPSLTKGVFQHSRIEGEAGRIVFESNGIYAWLSGRRKQLRFPVGDLMGYDAMWDDFVACVREGRTPLSDLDRAAKDLETVWRAYEIGGH